MRYDVALGVDYSMEATATLSLPTAYVDAKIPRHLRSMHAVAAPLIPGRCSGFKSGEYPCFLALSSELMSWESLPLFDKTTNEVVSSKLVLYPWIECAIGCA